MKRNRFEAITARLESGLLMFRLRHGLFLKGNPEGIPTYCMAVVLGFISLLHATSDVDCLTVVLERTDSFDFLAVRVIAGHDGEVSGQFFYKEVFTAIVELKFLDAAKSIQSHYPNAQFGGATGYGTYPMCISYYLKFPSDCNAPGIQVSVDELSGNLSRDLIL